MAFEAVLGSKIGGATGAITKGVKAAATGGAGASSFGDKLQALIDNVEETAADANTKVAGMIGAYQEIMRMPV